MPRRKSDVVDGDWVEGDGAFGPLALATQSVLGTPTSLSPAQLTAIADDAAMDRQIAEMISKGVPYPTQAEILGIPLPKLMRRLGSLMGARAQLLQPEMLDNYLAYQLQVLQEVTTSAMIDLQEQEREGLSPAQAAKVRQDARLSLIKATQMGSIATGLIRQRPDKVEINQVAITIVSKEDLDKI